MPERFNHDILANPGDLEDLKKQYPKLNPWLYWEELVDEFLTAEKQATLYKNRTYRTGKYAVWLSFAAVLFIALAPIINWLCTPILVAAGLDKYIAHAAQLLGAGTLCVSLFFIFLSFKGSSRNDWLANRIYGERLRQLFFQHLSVSLRQLCSTHSREVKLALEERKQLLLSTKERYGPKAGAAVFNAIEDTEHDLSILVPAHEGIAKGRTDKERFDQLFRYIQERRIRFQQHHAERQLDKTPRAKTGSVASREESYRLLTYVLIILFFMFQFMHVGFQFLEVGGVFSLEQGDRTTPVHALVFLFQAIAVVLAAGVIALKSTTDGMNLNHDLMRYRTYAGMSARIEKEFSQLGVEDIEKIKRLMLRMEDLAYWEMREFLALHQENRFS